MPVTLERADGLASRLETGAECGGGLVGLCEGGCQLEEAGGKTLGPLARCGGLGDRLFDAGAMLDESGFLTLDLHRQVAERADGLVAGHLHAGEVATCIRGLLGEAGDLDLGLRHLLHRGIGPHLDRAQVALESAGGGGLFIMEASEACGAILKALAVLVNLGKAFTELGGLLIDALGLAVETGEIGQGALELVLILQGRALRLREGGAGLAGLRREGGCLGVESLELFAFVGDSGGDAGNFGAELLHLGAATQQAAGGILRAGRAGMDPAARVHDDAAAGHEAGAAQGPGGEEHGGVEVGDKEGVAKEAIKEPIEGTDEGGRLA